MGDSPEFRFQWGRPWVVDVVVDWMNEYIQPHMRIFEWGSGGSTIWFAERAEIVHTVEHQPEWASALRALNLPNVVVHEVPAIYPDFVEYAAAIDHLGQFDLILIDGADGYDLGYVGSRDACAKRAIDHLVPGGAIILDNAGSASNIPAAVTIRARYPDRRPHIGVVLDPPGYREEKTETSVFVSPS